MSVGWPVLKLWVQSELNRPVEVLLLGVRVRRVTLKSSA
jgi:hypothetical protein